MKQLLIIRLPVEQTWKAEVFQTTSGPIVQMVPQKEIFEFIEN